MKRIRFLILVLLVFLAAGDASGGEASVLYSKAVSAAKAGKKDIAFVHFSAIIERHSGSKHTEKALFAAGEYYYSIGDSRDALSSFRRLVANFPESKGKLFALAYLYELSRESEKEELVKKVRKQIVTFKRQSFLFRVFKNYQYRSPLYTRHKAVYYIDRVEFYIDDQLFTEIPF